ncbi:DUF5994 family protein [Nocardia niigatensis]
MATPQQTPPGADRQFPSPRIPRLRLKPESSERGHVDGAWWPYSDDLTAELPDLLAELMPRLGPIARVIYHLDEWARAPAKIVVGASQVRLDGYRYKPVHTVAVLGVDGTSIDLLIVPPMTGSDGAYATMTAAAHPNNVSTVDDLLMIDVRKRKVRTRTEAAEQRWASEGGAGAN